MEKMNERQGRVRSVEGKGEGKIMIGEWEVVVETKL